MNLKANSVNVTKKTTLVWPQREEEDEVIDMTDIGSKFNGSYAINNSTICYVVNNEVFVTPYTREAMAEIKALGLTERHFYVPFSNWDYPKYQEERWSSLRKEARESQYRNYENDCRNWCAQHGVNELSKETMDRCFRIPRGGMKVLMIHYETVNYPICNEMNMDSATIDKLGSYNTNNGKVVFVYCDGHTYVAKGYSILEELKNAGYRKSNLYVPLSNGEKIVNPSLAFEWKDIPKK